MPLKGPEGPGLPAMAPGLVPVVLQAAPWTGDVCMCLQWKCLTAGGKTTHDDQCQFPPKYQPSSTLASKLAPTPHTSALPPPPRLAIERVWLATQTSTHDHSQQPSTPHPNMQQHPQAGNQQRTTDHPGVWKSLQNFSISNHSIHGSPVSL